MGKPSEAALLIKKKMSPYMITISKEWTGGKNVNTVIDYLARAVADKQLSESDIIYTILPRAKREVLQSAISRGITPSELYDVYQQHKDLWPSDPINQIRADYETVKRFGMVIEKSGKPGNRLGYLFEDVWTIEREMYLTIEKVMKDKFGEQWWTHVVGFLPPEQQPWAKSSSDVTLNGLVRIAKKCWPDVAPLLGAYSNCSPAIFKKDFYHIKKIRNGLFHPAGGYIFSEDDFELARHVRKTLLNE